MEETLGVVLFERAGQGITPTPAGEALCDHVGRAFAELNRGFDLVANRGPQLLRLHCAPSFAAQWLAPRLARFLSAHPGFEVRLAAGMDYARFITDEFDADIVYGPPRGEGLVRMPLGLETVTPLCDPVRAARIREPADLLAQTLIQSDNKQVRWSHWFERNQLVGAAEPRRFASTGASWPWRLRRMGSASPLNPHASPSGRLRLGASSRRWPGVLRTSATSATTSSARSTSAAGRHSGSSRAGSPRNSRSTLSPELA